MRIIEHFSRGGGNVEFLREDPFNASNQAVTIPARPYLKLTDEDFGEILDMTENFLKG